MMFCLDIVIPTFNEEANIAQTIESVVASWHLAESKRPAGSLAVRIYVADGGSNDRTVEIVRSFDVEVLQGGISGRGNQIAAGVHAGSGNLVLMLHADARMRENAIDCLLSALETDPAIVWGVLGHSYDTPQFKMRIIELSNRLRFLFGGIAFGDQGIFVRRGVLNHAGGVPKIRLMEDVELSLRLRKFRKRKNLGQLLQVSARRWERKGFTGYTFQVLCFVLQYLTQRALGMDVKVISDKMYERYYANRSQPTTEAHESSMHLRQAADSRSNEEPPREIYRH